MGANIDSSITKRTNFVILGEKPGPVKMKKIKEYNKDGALIKILSENEFLDIIS